MREVCFLIGAGDRVLWSDAGDSAVALADSRARWEAIWRLREDLVEIAHSHPVGPLAFSHEDETTMAAIAQALAQPPRFSIVAPGGMLARVEGQDIPIDSEPGWAAELRRASGMPARQQVSEPDTKAR